jgi:hypothetical protein
MSYIYLSNVIGKIPTIAQLTLSESKLGYNIADGLFYALQIQNGVKEVICIGGRNDIVETHSRAHSLISELDHLPSEPGDEGKIPQADPVTRKWKLVPMPAGGQDGSDGADGVSAFVYIAYASDTQGTGWSLTPSGQLKYISIIQSDAELTPLATDFSAASWIKYIGEDGVAGTSDVFEVYINFLDATPFVYNCPYPVRFTSQISEGTDATISPALNTDLVQFQKMTVTPSQVGLIILSGELL